MPARDLETIEKGLTEKRRNLKEEIFKERGFCEHPDCKRCDQSELVLHEAIITCNDLKKIDDPTVWKLVLFSKSNLLLLHNSTCHINRTPSREQAYEIAVKRDGLEETNSFFEMLDIAYEAGLIKVRFSRPKNFREAFYE